MTSSKKRLCGDCTLCCKVMAIEELAKPANIWCPYCKPGRGRTTYADRPTECVSFSCVWLVNDLLDEQWKPNKSKLVLTTSEDGIEIRCDPGFPDAWRKEPYGSEIREWAISGESNDVTVEIPLRYYTFDFIHLTGEGHAMIAATLLPRIMAAINRRP